jgi:hypothetical protein
VVTCPDAGVGLVLTWTEATCWPSWYRVRVWVTLPPDGALGGPSVATTWCQLPSTTSGTVPLVQGAVASVNGSSCR